MFYLSEEDYSKLCGKKKESKYKSKKIVLDGISFDSLKEANRYSHLILLQKAGEISDLQLQVPFVLVPAQHLPDTIGPRGGVKKGKCIEEAVVYYADFVYTDSSGEKVVEDTKGVRTAAYVIKRKLMLSVHGIRIKGI